MLLAEFFRLLVTCQVCTTGELINQHSNSLHSFLLCMSYFLPYVTAECAQRIRKHGEGRGVTQALALTEPSQMCKLAILCALMHLHTIRVTGY